MEAVDLIVVGLGHAGAEAALAAARLGVKVAAITQAPERACLMSCNPSIGGPGKSQLVKEIDALGGAMASAADETALQVRLLNRSKGAAGWATRIRVDRLAYALAMQRRLGEAARIQTVRGEVARLRTAGGRVSGVEFEDGSVLEASCVILTTGTFLAARMHVGRSQSVGGRAGDSSSEGLASQLRTLGLETGRFKTGTPPRLNGRTIHWARCEEQPSETDVGPLSLRSSRVGFPSRPQLSTHVTRTTSRTHDVVRRALADSPLTTGAITGRGPRYCPSLEQKVLSYPERLGHIVYLEPDGAETETVYAGGLSTSLPAAAQLELLRTIPGLEDVEILQPGYAVEYDHLLPGQLTGGLELKGLSGLFFAGQINGSSGYEEAAGQGLVAGVNAARRSRPGSSDPWIPSREDSYLGVLCDDIVSHRFTEPYRLLPARAERRLLLREDNAAQRLMPVALELGLVNEAQAGPTLDLIAARDQRSKKLTREQIRWLQHPERTVAAAREPTAPLEALDPEVAEAVFFQVRYAPYEGQRRVALERLSAAGQMRIPESIQLGRIPGLSAEARDSLASARPQRLSDAARLPGVSHEAVAILAVYLRRLQDLESVSRGTAR